MTKYLAKTKNPIADLFAFSCHMANKEAPHRKARSYQNVYLLPSLYLALAHQKLNSTTVCFGPPANAFFFARCRYDYYDGIIMVSKSGCHCVSLSEPIATNHGNKLGVHQGYVSSEKIDNFALSCTQPKRIHTGIASTHRLR